MSQDFWCRWNTAKTLCARRARGMRAQAPLRYGALAHAGLRGVIASVAVLAVTGCGGGGGGGGSGVESFRIAGTLEGLKSGAVQLSVQGSEPIELSSPTSFQFSGRYGPTQGAELRVNVAVFPEDVKHDCRVTPQQFEITNRDVNVRVSCAPAESLLSATTGDGQITLQWTRPFGGPASRGDMQICKAHGPDIEDVQFASGGGCAPPSVPIGLTPEPHFDPTSRRYTLVDGGLSNDEVYFYRVRFDNGERQVISNLAFAAPREVWIRTSEIPFNDTGITFPVDGSEYRGHDDTHGRDATVTSADKEGFGEAAFDFTKIANSSLDLSETAGLGSSPDQWSCIRDNVTGLMWEVRPNAPGQLRHREHRYRWFNSDAASNGGAAGSRSGNLCAGSLLACNTEAYVNRVNAIGLCGYTDWRVPTITELYSIVHFGKPGDPPAVDEDAFPDVPVDSGYWSATPSAADPDKALRLDLRPISESAADKEGSLALRLVRGGNLPGDSDLAQSGCRDDIGPTAQIERFDVSDPVPDGYACQPETGLLWRRCPLGQEWEGDGCSQSAATGSWERILMEAADYPDANTGLEPHAVWRLPNAKELLSIVERRCTNPSVDTRVFPGDMQGRFWTSSAVDKDVSGTWSVTFKPDPVKRPALLVRDSPSLCGPKD